MKRFYVSRAYLKWKGKMYYKGDLLPHNFTHHDKARSIYGSRIGERDFTEEEISAIEGTSAPTATETGAGDTSPKVTKTSSEVGKTSEKGSDSAAKATSRFHFPISGPAAT